MDKLDGMRLFVKVVELGSFAAAAEALEVSRAMATTHIARLEERLGVRLLNRTTRRLSLTEAGSAYYERCAAVVAEIDTLEHSLQAMAEEPRGVVKITAPVSFGTSHLGPALGDYLDRYPHVRLDVSLSDRTVDLVEEGYDLAVRISRLADSTLVARRIASTHVLACAAPAYLARRGHPSQPRDLGEHDCLGYAYSGSGGLWEFAGPDGPAAVRVRTETRANSGDLLRVLAKHGHGIALLPEFLITEELAAGTLVEILPGYSAGELGIFALYPSRKFLSAKVRTLVDFLAQRFARIEGGVPERARTRA